MEERQEFHWDYAKEINLRKFDKKYAGEGQEIHWDYDKKGLY